VGASLAASASLLSEVERTDTPRLLDQGPTRYDVDDPENRAPEASEFKWTSDQALPCGSNAAARQLRWASEDIQHEFDEEVRRGWLWTPAISGDLALPVAITVFPDDVYRAPETWARRAYRNLIYFHELDKGGHFAAWEQPFSVELRAAFGPLRRW